jgi:hypothetical protein
MWKRRVGVTARSRRIVGNQTTGSPQIATEIAAPLELRTPMGTAAAAAQRVRMEAWRQWRGSQSAEPNPTQKQSGAEVAAVGGRARCARHEAQPHTSPGGKPPETPGPLSLELRLYARERNGQGFATPAQSAALDRFAPLRRRQLRRGKGGLRQSRRISASRWSASGNLPGRDDQARCARHEALPHPSPGGQAPLRPPGGQADFFP